VQSSSSASFAHDCHRALSLYYTHPMRVTGKQIKSIKSLRNMHVNANHWLNWHRLPHKLLEKVLLGDWPPCSLKL